MRRQTIIRYMTAGLMRRQIIIRYLAAGILEVFMICSASLCVSALETETPEETTGKTVIGVTLATEEEEEGELAQALLEAAARDETCQLEICYAGWDAQVQEQQIRTFLEEKVDAVILCPVNVKSFLNVLKEAQEEGIPVIDLDMKLDTVSTEYVATYVGASMSEEADLAAQAVIGCYGETGAEVGIIEGAVGSDPQIYRTQTFLETLSSYPDIEIVSIINGGWSREKAQLAAYDLLNKNADLDLIYCHDGSMALGAWEMMKELGKDSDVKIIGIGSEEEYLQAVKDGKLYAVISQPVQYEAEYAVSCAKRAAKGEVLRSWYKNSVELITAENVEQYMEINSEDSLYW